MWLADCQYVRACVQKLLPPRTFPMKMRRFKDKGSAACTGRMRWAAEHWIHSHPSVKPCDLYTEPNFLFGYDGLPELSEYLEPLPSSSTLQLEEGRRKASSKWFSLQQAPRFDLEIFSSTGLCVLVWTSTKYCSSFGPTRTGLVGSFGTPSHQRTTITVIFNRDNQTPIVGLG